MSSHPLRIAPPPVNTVPTEDQKKQAARWFEELRDRLCLALEAIEEEYHGAVAVAGSERSERTAEQSRPHLFARKFWERTTPDGSEGGGGTMALLRGRVFEKAGVNISQVHGTFSKEFRAQIPGASENGDFWAAGISMVVHPAHPRVPAVHMNTRHIVTSHGWFGGGGDLNPVFPDTRDTADFHAALKAACDRFSPDYYPRYKKWCDEYFYIPHRNKPRGVGGVFFDTHDSGDWESDFAFTKAIGEAVLEIYPQLVRRYMNTPFTAEEREQQLIWRGHYAEFNLAYDRGTKFGLATGGNTEAILMSLPPEAKWP